MRATVFVLLLALISAPAISAPIQLWCPWTSGQSWIAGNPGSFYNQGYHTGSDYWAVDFNKSGGSDSGEAIRAAADGWIREASWSDSYGWHVRIQHSENSNYWTLYAHFASDPKSDPGIQVNQFVGHGVVIGKCGSTGWSTGSHLHFMLYDGSGNSVQPSPMSGQTINTNENGKVLVSNNDPSPPADPNNIWLDFGYGGPFVGTQSQPLNNVDTAINAINSGGTMHIKPGSSSWTGTISKPMTMQAEGGSVTIGH